MTLKDKNNFIPLTLATFNTLLIGIVCYAAICSPIDDYKKAYFLFLLCCVILLSLLFIVSCFTVGKQFDKVFKDTLLNNDDCDDMMWTEHLSLNCRITRWHRLKRYRFYRSLLYIRCLVYPNITKNRAPYTYMFEGYNFPKHANTTSLVITYIIRAILMVVVFYTAVVVMCILGSTGPT